MTFTDKMAFIDKLEKEILGEKVLTENGAVGYRTSGKELLDLNFKVSSYRNSSPEEIIHDFGKAYYEDKEMALRWLFYARDVRGGLGERRLFRTIFPTLDGRYIPGLIPLIAEYGRYDDLFVLLDTSYREDVVDYIGTVLEKDIYSANKGNPISLLAKWLPSENASSSQTKKWAKIIRKGLQLSSKQYRNLLTFLRQHIGIVETQMSENKWGEIKYSAVPSKASLNYKGAFLRHDEGRYNEYLESVKKGEQKINASTLYPYEIVARYGSSSRVDPALEEMWKALPNPTGEFESVLVVADGSGSMTWGGFGKNVRPIDVANSLAIYCAERCKGEFKNKYITFSSRPQLVKLTGETLRDNLNIALLHDECDNTNIEAVFKLILDTAIKSKSLSSDLPSTVLVISDMEFDGSTCGTMPNATLFENLAKLYEDNGYKLPRLVFWNVNGRTNAIPVQTNEAGVALVSGFSVNTFNMVRDNEVGPYKVLLKAICTPRYDPIGEIVKNLSV